MRPEETLDEAIDRVASHMTRSDPNADLAPVWLTRAPRGWIWWRVAGVGLAVALLGVALTIAQGDRRGEVYAPVDSLPLVAWSPLHAPVSEVSGTREGVPHVPTRALMTPKSRMARAVEEDRPTWGVPFIGAPTALAVSEVSTPDIQMDAVGVSAIDLTPLPLSTLDRDAGASSSKEQ